MDLKILERVHIDGMYDAQLRRQVAELRVFMEDESLILDPALNYETIWGLSSEVKERLARVRPTSVVSVSFSLDFVVSW